MFTGLLCNLKIQNRLKKIINFNFLKKKRKDFGIQAEFAEKEFCLKNVIEKNIVCMMDW